MSLLDNDPIIPDVITTLPDGVCMPHFETCLNRKNPLFYSETQGGFSVKMQAMQLYDPWSADSTQTVPFPLRRNPEASPFELIPQTVNLSYKNGVNRIGMQYLLASKIKDAQNSNIVTRGFLNLIIYRSTKENTHVISGLSLSDPYTEVVPFVISSKQRNERFLILIPKDNKSHRRLTLIHMVTGKPWALGEIAIETNPWIEEAWQHAISC